VYEKLMAGGPSEIEVYVQYTVLYSTFLAGTRYYIQYSTTQVLLYFIRSLYGVELRVLGGVAGIECVCVWGVCGVGYRNKAKERNPTRSGVG